MKSLIVIALVLFSGLSFAQQAQIKGSIKDATTSEALIGATAVLKGTSKGAASDIDGAYHITGIDAGTYTLVVSSVSFVTQEKEITLTAGQTLTLDFTLAEDVQTISEVVVEGKAELNTANAVLAVQQNSGIVMDGLSSEQITKSGDSDAASAIRRVTGVSVEGGKYVYVRGLGDRYSKTTLNGAEIPGLDPNRNSVQMDLFPSGLIENMVISKTFSPDLPASFSGGYVDIVTRDFPSYFTLQFSNSLGFNTQTTLNSDFLTYKGGKTDWLGMDDGTRAIPTLAKDGIPSYGEALVFADKAQQLDQISKSFNQTMDVERKSAAVNQSHSFSIGNKHTLAGRDFGYFASINYQRNFAYYGNGETGRYSLTDYVDNVESLNPRFKLNSQNGTESVLWGAVLNTSYKVTDKTQLSLNLLHNQSSDKAASYREGLFDEDGQVNPNNIYQTRVLSFLERSMNSAQLKSKSKIGDKGELTVLTSFTRSTQNEPDLRFFTNDYFDNGEQRTYRVQSAAYADPSRYFRDMSETNFDNKVSLSLPITIGSIDGFFKNGAGIVMKDRDFNERRFDYVTNSSSNTYTQTGEVSDYIGNGQMGMIGGTSEEPVFGTFMRDNTQPSNSYTGSEKVAFAFSMVDVNILPKLRMLAGVRYERTDILVQSDNKRLKAGSLEYNDFLPAINMTYKISDKTNFRLGYGRTLARPTFRELAPFASFDFVGDFVLVGNPLLKRTLVDNVDLRWEMYPSSGEIITASLFYKNFTNPIEKAIIPQAANLEQQFRNVDQAQVIGMEFEFRKNLEFVGSSLKNFMLGSNITLVKSIVDIDPNELAQIHATDPYRAAQRPMFGQSPFLVNSFLNYDNAQRGYTANLSFNIFGKRLAAVSAGGLPNVFEKSRPSLDFTFGKSLSDRFRMLVKARNLLNPAYKSTHEFKGKEYLYNSYRIGSTYSLTLTYLID